MSQLRLDDRKLGEAVREAKCILEQAIYDYKPNAVIGLWSGGNDSTATIYLTRDYLTHAAHVNTGIGIEDTREFVRYYSWLNWLSLIEVAPTEMTYEDVILKYGFPGGAMHSTAYSWLKERPLRHLKGMFVDNPRQDRVLFVTGVRVHESRRRMGTAKEVDREGSAVWVAPLLHFTDEELRRVRSLYGIPESPTAARLGFSGECLCGAMAKPLEILDVEAAYPEYAKYIHELEARVESREDEINAFLWSQYEKRLAKWRANPYDSKRRLKAMPEFTPCKTKWAPGGTTTADRKARMCHSCVTQGQEQFEVSA